MKPQTCPELASGEDAENAEEDWPRNSVAVFSHSVQCFPLRGNKTGETGDAVCNRVGKTGLTLSGTADADRLKS